MKKYLKGAITAGAAGIILAGGMASPASADIKGPFYVTGPGSGKCRELDIEFYTPGSSQAPRHESLLACGNRTTTAHFRSNHTHVRTTVRDIWNEPFKLYSN